MNAFYISLLTMKSSITFGTIYCALDPVRIRIISLDQDSIEYENLWKVVLILRHAKKSLKMKCSTFCYKDNSNLKF
jgi:hypothetical protein